MDKKKILSAIWRWSNIVAAIAIGILLSYGFGYDSGYDRGYTRGYESGQWDGSSLIVDRAEELTREFMQSLYDLRWQARNDSEE